MQAEIKTVKNDAQNTILLAEEKFDIQLENIRQKTEALALTEAEERVKTILKAQNLGVIVEANVEQEVQRVLGNHIQRKIEESLKEFNNDLNDIVELVYAASEMRIGARSGYEKLNLFSNSHKKEDFKKRASILINEITSYYKIVKFEGYASYFSDKSVQDIIRIIKEEYDLHHVAAAFNRLNEITNEKFEMFDFRKVSDWAANNK
ncbi:hypothetical protein ASZ90_003289 [hydrocarbon metagenome]|uniref:Uncharacterized protein n=1 Tax=hydrocarbon metagenome TaxID=938273 RepID=A0A0W8G185_9ZZZZ